MNLLAGTKDLIDVYPSSVGSDEFGAETLIPGDTSSTPDRVYCTVMRPDSATDTAGGYDTSLTRHVYARRFPYRARSVVRYEGEFWDVVDEPEVRDYSIKTAYAKARIVRR